MTLKELDDLQEIARMATIAELENYEPISDEWKAKLTLGIVFEGEDRIFELYVPGEHPADAIVISSARVNRKTRSVTVDISNVRRKSNNKLPNSRLDQP